MARINLLRHQSTFKTLWDAMDYDVVRLPEVILEGEHVLHTDELGNILMDDESDQLVRKVGDPQQQILTSVRRAPKIR